MLKILSQQIAKEIQERLKSQEIKDFIIKIKEAGDDRKFKVIASTGAVDRYNEIVVPEGGNFKNFLKDPVILWGHQYRELPIGMAEKVYVEDGKVIVEGIFAPADANPEAEKVKKLYDGGFIRAVSIGFMPFEWEDFKDEGGYKRRYTKWELLELSFVTVPANPEALDIIKSMGEKLGIDTDKMLAASQAKNNNNTEQSVKDLALIIKDIVAEIKQIKNHNQEPKSKTEENGNKDKVDGIEERKIILTGDFAKNLRKDVQVADKVLESVNISLKKILDVKK